MATFQPLTAQFLQSAASWRQCPLDEVPEIAFVGRSNVGKSSTINTLTANNSLARVSKTPGRTQLINLFELMTTKHNPVGRLVDLPGFGFAKASKQQRADWGELVDAYLRERANLCGLVLVMDARHPPFEFDQQMIEWCAARELRLLLLLNKSDKLKRNRQLKALAAIEKLVGQYDHVEAIIFSATQRLGLDAAVQILRAWFLSASNGPETIADS